MALPGELPPLVELSDQTLWIRENTLALDRRVCGAPTCPLGGGFCFRCHPQQLGKVPSPSSSQAQPPFEMEHQFSSSLLVKIHPSPYWGRLGTQPPGDRATERTIGSRKDTPQAGGSGWYCRRSQGWPTWAPAHPAGHRPLVAPVSVNSIAGSSSCGSDNVPKSWALFLVLCMN